MKCKFAISVPYYCMDAKQLLNNEHIKRLVDIFRNNGIKYHTCDTIPGWYNLNQEWIETETFIDCDISFSFVLPVEWTEEERKVLKYLAFRGDIIIQVWYVKSTERIERRC
jgi:hypothetical protein